MFKRVAKRQRKLEEEEELGITEEMKEVMGMHDTDSDESDSSEEEGEGSGAAEDEAGASDGDTRIQDVESEEEDEDEDADEELDEDDEDEDAPARPPLTVTEAIADPIYPISSKSDVKACAVCPAKRLKTGKLVEAHRNSKAHYRRFARFVEFAGTADPDTDMDDFWRALDEENKAKAPQPKVDGPLSKRAEKRKAKLEAIKAKRIKSKELKAKGMARRAAIKAKKLAEAEAAVTDEPSNKSKDAAEVLEKKKISKSDLPPPKKKQKVTAEREPEPADSSDRTGASKPKAKSSPAKSARKAPTDTKANAITSKSHAPTSKPKSKPQNSAAPKVANAPKASLKKRPRAVS